jgi:hypothetical protein
MRSGTSGGSGSASPDAGSTLLRTGPDEAITLNLDGGQSAREVRPVPESLALSGEKDASHTP